MLGFYLLYYDLNVYDSRNINFYFEQFQVPHRYRISYDYYV